ncbi:MAG: LapA family protein [Spirochaetes bacterium]|nr:LapA family protein [Spirochaetota bacterium]
MKVRQILTLFILLLFLIIILQNTQPVSFTVFVWDITLPLIVMLLTVFIAGLIIGTLFGTSGKRRKNITKL